MNITVNQTISADLKNIRFPVLFFDWEGAGRGDGLETMKIELSFF